MKYIIQAGTPGWRAVHPKGTQWVSFETSKLVTYTDRDVVSGKLDGSPGEMVFVIPKNLQAWGAVRFSKQYIL